MSNEFTPVFERKITIDKYSWTAKCNEAKMKRERAECPLAGFVLMPAIEYTVTRIKPCEQALHINVAENKCRKPHQLITDELNRNLYNVISHICDMCPYKANQK